MGLEDGLVGLYHGNGDFTDSSGSSFDLSPNGATIDTVNQKLGSGAMAFDGDNDYASGSFTALDFNNPWSLLFWLNPRDLGGAGNEVLLNLTDTTGIQLDCSDIEITNENTNLNN